MKKATKQIKKKNKKFLFIIRNLDFFSYCLTLIFSLALLILYLVKGDFDKTLAIMSFSFAILSVVSGQIIEKNNDLHFKKIESEIINNKRNNILDNLDNIVNLIYYEVFTQNRRGINVAKKNELNSKVSIIFLKDLTVNFKLLSMDFIEIKKKYFDYIDLINNDLMNVLDKKKEIIKIKEDLHFKINDIKNKIFSVANEDEIY